MSRRQCSTRAISRLVERLPDQAMGEYTYTCDLLRDASMPGMILCSALWVMVACVPVLGFALWLERSLAGLWFTIELVLLLGAGTAIVGLIWYYAIYVPLNGRTITMHYRISSDSIILTEQSARKLSSVRIHFADIVHIQCRRDELLLTAPRQVMRLRGAIFQAAISIMEQYQG